MSELELACDCGKVSGVLSDISPRKRSYLVCYCDDCQQFAKELGRESDVLDSYGGTGVVQGTLAQVTIRTGQEHLKSLRLTSRGILRWYAECCNTPIANTVSAKLPFVGVVRSFVKDERAEELLGPVSLRIFGRFANDPPDDLDIHPRAPITLAFQLGPRILGARLRGEGRDSSFFDAAGEPTVPPRVVSEAG